MSEKSAAELAAEMEASSVDAVLGGRPEDDTAADQGESEQAAAVEEAAAAANPAADAGQPSQADTPAAAAETEAPILGGGGKTIPYSVLKETRQKAHEAQQEVERLRAELDAAKANRSTPAAEAAETLDEADYEDLPEPLVKRLRQMEERVNTLQQREQQQVQAEQRAAAVAAAAAAESTQTAIDAIPELVAWQAKGGAEWEAAVAADSRLMNSPAWANKPLAERIAKAAELAALELGLPPPAKPAVTTTKQTTAPKAAARPAITSLTDLAGGGMPAVDSTDYLENASASQLAARMNSMSTADIDRLLRETG